ncbi:shikimate kinase [Pontixanthobacter sp.]|uniref:shikimate kinase n=1 Tax=Pontixanthobacter sp. TaxID=2792078 RepID=UPI003C7BAC8A
MDDNSAFIGSVAQRIVRPVVLIGLMGTGKSSVGRKLAFMLDREFIDSDDAIEEAAQQSIAEIFETYGEAYFRDGERRVIARLLAGHTGVIATGGGAFINDDTRSLILDQAITVWIDCEIGILVERTGRKNTRPLLQNGDPHEILSRLHAEREPFYSQAPIRVESRDGPHQDTAMLIIEAIDRWL